MNIIFSSLIFAISLLYYCLLAIIITIMPTVLLMSMISLSRTSLTLRTKIYSLAEIWFWTALRCTTAFQFDLFCDEDWLVVLFQPTQWLTKMLSSIFTSCDGHRRGHRYRLGNRSCILNMAAGSDSFLAIGAAAVRSSTMRETSV